MSARRGKATVWSGVAAASEWGFAHLSARCVERTLADLGAARVRAHTLNGPCDRAALALAAHPSPSVIAAVRAYAERQEDELSAWSGEAPYYPDGKGYWPSVVPLLDLPVHERTLKLVELTRHPAVTLSWVPTGSGHLHDVLAALAKLPGPWHLAAQIASYLVRIHGEPTDVERLQSFEATCWADRASLALVRVHHGNGASDWPPCEVGRAVPAWFPMDLHPAIGRDGLTNTLSLRAEQQPESSLASPGSALWREDTPAPWVLYVDIDHMLELNDYYGFGAGDAVIIGIAGTLQSFFGDRVLRVAGDKFRIYWEGEAAADLADGLRAAVEAASYRGPDDLDELLRRTVSIGVAHGTLLEPTIKAAEKALHEAKCQGRNKVVVAS